MARDKDADFDSKLRDASKEHKYHLVQNYNNDLIRRSLKSQNNHNRLNIKEHKANLHFENITKKIEEKNRKKMAQMIGRAGHNQMKSMGAHKGHEDLEIEVENQSESVDKLPGKGERASNCSYNGNTVSSNVTPNSNVSFSTNKSNRLANPKRKAHDQVSSDNTNKLLIKNTLIQKLKKRNTSKTSNKSNRESIAKDEHLNKQPKQGKNTLGGDPKYPRQGDERVLHLTLTGAKHNTNLVQINNYINKLHREEIDSLGISDARSHQQSTHSNSSNVYSNKQKIKKKAENHLQKDFEMQIHANKMRKEVANPLKPQNRIPLVQPILSNLQNKNVLTLTQNLLQKRHRND